jgi:hypothetical protein
MPSSINTRSALRRSMYRGCGSPNSPPRIDSVSPEGRTADRVRVPQVDHVPPVPVAVSDLRVVNSCLGRLPRPRVTNSIACAENTPHQPPYKNYWHEIQYCFHPALSALLRCRNPFPAWPWCLPSNMASELNGATCLSWGERSHS